MDMEERRDEYGFCPKCGAITQNGVCQSCGYGKRPGMSVNTNTTESYGEVPKKKKRMSAGGKVVIGLVILLAVLLIVFIVLAVRAVMDHTEQSNPIIGDGFFDGFENDYDGYEADDDWWDDDYNYGEAYVPSPEDEYYVELADAVRQDLSYGIEWHTESWYPESEDDYSYSSVSYPVLTGEDEEKLAQVNEEIYALAYADKEKFKDYNGSVGIDVYVTYMSEERLSVVFHSSIYGENDSMLKLSAKNFDMSTGEIIPYEDMLQVDDGLVKKFRSQDSLQNDTVDYVAELSDGELLACLQDNEQRVMFYTPVGLELGLNYPDGNGWVTVTLKDDAL